MKYRVMATSAAEYKKASLDPTYSPKEFEVGVIVADTEKAAQYKLRIGIGTGVYPRGSQLVEVAESLGASAKVKDTNDKG